MLFFLVGLFVGATITVVTLALCNIAKSADESIDKVR